MPRPDLRGAHAGEWDDRVADLHYADTPEYATGHGLSAEWDLVDDECRSIRTAWIGTAEVEKTATANVPGVELSMDALGRLDDGTATQQALGPLVVKYRVWIERHHAAGLRVPGEHHSVVDAPRLVNSDASPIRPECAVTRLSTPAASDAAVNRCPNICADNGTTRSPGSGLVAARSVRMARATPSFTKSRLSDWKRSIWCTWGHGIRTDDERIPLRNTCLRIRRTSRRTTPTGALQRAPNYSSIMFRIARVPRHHRDARDEWSRRMGTERPVSAAHRGGDVMSPTIATAAMLRAAPECARDHGF